MSSIEIKQLTSLLEKHFQKPIKILDKQSKYLVPPGENYGSIMLALDLVFKEENDLKTELNTVAKLMPASEVLCDLFHIQVTFKKELYVYTTIVPELVKIEDEFNIKEGRASQLFATCFGGRPNLKTDADPVDNDAVILFENLKKHQYENGDRLLGYNYECAAFVMKNLARFHAIPIAMKIQKPEVYKKTIYHILTKNEEGFSNMDIKKTEPLIARLKQILMARPEFEREADKMVADLTNKYQTDFFRSIPMDEPFSTFVHSDFWMNNLMLRFDPTGKPISMKIVDFQTPQNQSCIFDLLFFLYSSVTPTVLHAKVDELIQIYYDAFVACLQEFNVNLENYTWEKFQEELRTKGLGVLSQTLVMYKYILLERGHISDMSEMNEDELFTTRHITPAMETRMVDTFVSFVEHGWIP